MARMRVVKPELWTDKITGAWPAEVRDLFIALIVQADDHGRYEVDAVAIRAAVYPRQSVSDADVTAHIDRMVKDGRVALYDIEERRYLAILRFYKHQRPQRRFQPRYPAPPTEILARISQLNGGYCPQEHTRVYASSHTSLVRGMGDGGLGNGGSIDGGSGGSGADASRPASPSAAASREGREGKQKQTPEQFAIHKADVVKALRGLDSLACPSPPPTPRSP